MRKSQNIFGWLTLALALGLSAYPAFAQRSLGQGKHKAEKKRAEGAKRNLTPGAEATRSPAAPATEFGKNSNPQNPAGQNIAAQKRDAAAQNLPPQWMERLQTMEPADQERFMNNNERFRSLPPERKAQIRARLREFRQLSPEQRQQLRTRASVWEKIPPEKRQLVRQQLLPKWKNMAPDRRAEIKRRLNALNGLSDDERAARLNDPEFVRGLNPNEQAMLRDLSDLRVTAAPNASDGEQ